MAPSSHHPKLPPPPKPTRILFDPFNSSSTGHQTAPSRPSGTTLWKASRTNKLSHQFRDTAGGGGRKHISDLVGAGSENWLKDGRKENGDWEVGAPGLREAGWQDIRGLMAGNAKKRKCDNGNDSDDLKKRSCRITKLTTLASLTREKGSDAIEKPAQEQREPYGERLKKVELDVDETNRDALPPPQIFRGLNIYLNGSTAPLVSDHKLKQLFTRHGGNTSIGLGRRTVTHVVLGENAGGGLASGKIQKENATVRGKGIKYVTAQWVLDSVERGIRQPESRYAAAEVKDRLGGSRQRSVSALFRRE